MLLLYGESNVLIYISGLTDPGSAYSESPSSPGLVKHPDSLSCVQYGYNDSGMDTAELTSFQSINPINVDDTTEHTVGTLMSDKCSFKTTAGDTEWITDQSSTDVPRSDSGQASTSKSELDSSDAEVRILVKKVYT